MKDKHSHKMELIRLFLEGNLTEESRQQILDEIENDPFLEEELDFRKSFALVHKYQDIFELDDKIQKAIQQRREHQVNNDISSVQSPDSPTKNKRWLPFVISILLISTLSIIYLPSMYEKYRLSHIVDEMRIKQFENITNSSESDQVSFSVGMDAYLNRNFPVAIEELSKVALANENEEVILLYLGLSYYYNGKYTKSFDALSKVGIIEEELMVPARFHMALCKLKIGDAKSAKALLELILDSHPYYSNIARDIISKI